MVKLGDIQGLGEIIKNAPASTARTLFQITFGRGVARLNRRSLLNFEGFAFELNSEEFKQKVAAICEEFSVAELTAACTLLQINFSGTTEEIATRICRGLTNLNELMNQDLDEEIDEENYEDHDDNRNEDENGRLQRESSVSVSQSIASAVPKFTMTFRDVEDSLKTFSGDKSYSIESWLSDFEDLALLMEWTDLQKLIFAKKSLTGLAKLFIQGLRGVKTWSQLRRALIDEFATRVNSADLHRQLSNRKLGRDESLQEYLLKMKEMASRANIEEEAVVQYVVDGIPEETDKKLWLYEAKTYNQLKQKLDVYAKIRQIKFRSNVSGSKSNFRRPVEDKEVSSSSASVKSSTVRKCYNCNAPGHIATNCPKPRRERGSCFECGKLDHKATECPKQKRPVE